MYNVNEKIIQYLKKLENQPVPVSGEETKTDKDEKKKQLVEEIKRLNSELSGKKNTVQLDAMEFTPLTEKELKKQATDKVEPKYQAKENSLETKKDTAVKKLELENQKLQDEGKNKKESVEKAYIELEDKLNKNAIKRGIARSSIVSEQVRNLGVEKIRDLLGVDQAVANEIKINSDKIASLEQEYVSAVNDLSIEKALEISEVIDKLTEEQNAKLEKVIKYNNDIKKQQATLDEKVTYLTKAEKNEINGKIVNLVIEYYNTLPKEERLLAFESDEDILDILGDNASLVERYLRASA
ncbi:MAG: hypothetical protein E7358_02080 [Clostridiales bacterium]|nr:hypothetical protein [Clostridiales bacterium]